MDHATASATPNLKHTNPLRRWRARLAHPEFDLGTLEPAYRQSTLAADIAQIKALLYIYLGAIVIYAFNDYQLFGWSAHLSSLLLARVVLISISLFEIYSLNRLTTYEPLDRLILGLTLPAVFIHLFIIFSRPLALSFMDLLIVLTVYLLIPNRFYYRLIPALLFSLGDLVLFWYWRSEVGAASVFALGAALLIGNIVGLTTSQRLYVYRRNQFRAQHEEKMARQEIERLVNIDPLTQIFNRRRFSELAEAECQRFNRYQQVYSLLLCDLDHFKQINDTYGHLAGDTVLKQFAALLNAQRRASDVAGRMGGEEFALLLPETPAAAAEVVANRLRERCEQLRLATPEGAVRVTVSMGIAEAQISDETHEDVYRRADQALYQAKRKGRNRVELNVIAQPL